MTPADHHVAAQAALYGPRAADLRSQLTDVGDGLAAAFSTLHQDPHPASAELLAIRLEGARRHVLQLAEAIRRKGTE